MESVNKIETNMDLLDCMEEFNLLSPINTWFLQYMLYRVGSKPLYKQVYEYATTHLKSLNVLHVYEPKEIPGM